MAIGPRLDLRQTQSLVMTPQLQQAIKLLALSNLEIEAFVEQAIADNPLLELGETEREAPSADTPESPDALSSTADAGELMAQGHGETDAPLDIDPAALDRDRDTGDWSAAHGSGVSHDDLPDIGESGEPEPTLAQYLETQIGTATADPVTRLIARHIIGRLDEAGYLTAPVREIAGEIGCTIEECESALSVVQSLDPTGVGARSLAECLALQAKEADRYDPCMARLIDNLDLVARGAFPQLKRMCNVDDEDFVDMLAELRSYDPKPGLKLGGGGAAAVVPDIFVAPGGDGWHIALNQDTLPRLIVNREYYLEMREGCGDKSAKSWLSEKLADANALVKALDQRQKTVLKVTQEIVRHQAAFFRRGVAGLKPLTLRTVAEAIEMHESTVSRVTSNKYLQCNRGTFELKYFFSSGVASTDSEDGVSAEAVKAEIRTLVDAEDPGRILSDDKLVELLKGKGFDLARRTVAKYREAIGIGSSVQRRRQKKLEGVR